MFYNHPPLNSFFADTYGITGSEPPKMTENRKIRLGSVKGDTLVTKLQRPTLAFEWTECQLQSPSVVGLNKNVNSNSLHIKCTKSIWHLARTVWVMKCVWVCRINTCINSFYVCNNIRVLYMSVFVWMCVWREAMANESSCINHVWISSTSLPDRPYGSDSTVHICKQAGDWAQRVKIIKPRQKGM